MLHPARRGKPQLAAERERLRTWACEQIDAFIRRTGMAPEKFIDEDGWRWFEQGSATGFALVDEVDGEVYVQVAAGVMPLPADRDLIVPLMRELLELNTSILGSARFGIRNRRVHATVSAKVADLEAADFGVLINEVMALADAVDDDLAKKYGGSSKPRKGA